MKPYTVKPLHYTVATGPHLENIFTFQVVSLMGVHA